MSADQSSEDLQAIQERWLDTPAEADLVFPSLEDVREREESMSTLRWATRRMLQALDAYWLGFEGLPQGRYPRGKYDSEDWWHRFEKYRAIVEASS